jgi:hypothetical protein
MIQRLLTIAYFVCYRLLTIILLVQVVVPALAQTAADPEQSLPAGRFIYTGYAVDLIRPTFIEPGTRLQSICAAPSKTPYSRHRWKLLLWGNASEEDWLLRVFDGAGEVVDEIDSQTLQTPTWTVQIAGNCSTIEVPVNGVRVRIIQMMMPAEDEAALKSLYPPEQKNPYKNARTVSAVAAIRDSIVHLSLVMHIGDKEKEYPCSGVLISDDMILTNNHCVPSNDNLVGATANIGWYKTKPKASRRAIKLLVTDSKLDYSIVQINKKVDTMTSFLPWLTSSPRFRTRVVQVHHPSGMIMKVSDDQYCRVYHQIVEGRGAGTSFAHRCDCEPGSSGSVLVEKLPTIDNCQRIVGLHRMGAGELLEARDGSKILDEKNYFNKASRMDLIIKDLRCKANGYCGGDNASQRGALRALRQIKTCGS